MEPIRINPDEFKLENFINYYNDNVEELLSEYPNYVSRICLIDRDYMDVVIFDEDYEELEDASDYKKLLLNGEYALHFAIGKTYEGAEKVEFIDGKKYILNHYLDDIYEDNSTIKDIGELSLNVDNLIGLLFDFEEEDEEIVISVVDFEHGGGLSNPRIREVDDSGDIENILKELIEKYGNDKIVVSIDAKNGKVATHGWEKVSDIDSVDLCKELEQIGVKTIVYTDISKDGMLEGPNFDIYKELSQKTSLDIIASGGVTSIDDIKKLRDMNMYGAIIGKALYDKKLDLKEVIDLC